MDRTQIDHPFLPRYLEGRAGARPIEAYNAHKAIEASIDALASAGQVRVWTLQRCDEDFVSSIFVSLRKAIDGAVSIVADELVGISNVLPEIDPLAVVVDMALNPDEVKEEHERLRYQGYMKKEVEWGIVHEHRFFEGDVLPAGYRIHTTYGDVSYEWDILWHEVM